MDSIYEKIAQGQCDKRPYGIWSIFHREDTLVYWYVVMFDDTYDKWATTPNEKKRKKIEQEFLCKATDIRNLDNYEKMGCVDAFLHRKDKVIPMIKEAVRKGYIKPL